MRVALALRQRDAIILSPPVGACLPHEMTPTSAGRRSSSLPEEQSAFTSVVSPPRRKWEPLPAENFSRDYTYRADNTDTSDDTMAEPIFEVAHAAAMPLHSPASHRPACARGALSRPRLGRDFATASRCLLESRQYRATNSPQCGGHWAGVSAEAMSLRPPPPPRHRRAGDRFRAT